MYASRNISLTLSLSLYIYICIHIYVYIYIYIERERDNYILNNTISDACDVLFTGPPPTA